MGYFCLAQEETVEGCVKAAISNLELLLKHTNTNETNYEYLLKFAMGNLQDARDIIDGTYETTNDWYQRKMKEMEEQKEDE
jgi:hypothetical protein